MQTTKTQDNFRSFVFTHIPKCGGTSFREYLNTSALKSGLNKNQLFIPGFNSLNNDLAIEKMDAENIVSLKQKKIIVIGDHSRYGSLERNGLYLSNPFYFTILRDPVARFLSHYHFFYFKLGNEGCKGISINELPENKLLKHINYLANVQTAYLAKFRRKRLIGNENLVKLAKYNLEYEFNAFGILENMDRSLELLKIKAPGWLRFGSEFPFMNHFLNDVVVNQYIIDLIMEKNYLDLDLYQHAMNIFNKKSIKEISQ